MKKTIIALSIALAIVCCVLLLNKSRKELTPPLTNESVTPIVEPANHTEPVASSNKKEAEEVSSVAKPGAPPRAYPSADPVPHNNYSISLLSVEASLNPDGINKHVHLKLRFMDKSQDPTIKAISTIGIWHKLMSDAGSIKLSPETGSSLSKVVARTHVDAFTLNTMVKASVKTLTKAEGFVGVVHSAEDRTVDLPLNALPSNFSENGFEFTCLSCNHGQEESKVVMKVRSPKGTALEPQSWARHFIDFQLICEDGTELKRIAENETGLDSGERIVSLTFARMTNKFGSSLRVKYVARILEERYPFVIENVALPDASPAPVTFVTGKAVVTPEGFSMKLKQLGLNSSSMNRSLNGTVEVGVPPSMASRRIFCGWESAMAQDTSGSKHSLDVDAEKMSFKRPLSETGTVTLKIVWGSEPPRDISLLSGNLVLNIIEEEENIKIEIPGNLAEESRSQNAVQSLVKDGSNWIVAVKIEAVNLAAGSTQIFGASGFRLELEDSQGKRVAAKGVGAKNREPQFLLRTTINAPDFVPVRVHVMYPSKVKALPQTINFTEIKLSSGK